MLEKAHIFSTWANKKVSRRALHLNIVGDNSKYLAVASFTYRVHFTKRTFDND